ncbi:MAG: AAA family ATPase [Bacteroidota bacterium]
MRLPIGVQTFTEIRERDLLYIDKTESISKILRSGKYFFLSRPRRFGKSLLLSTMKSLYSCEKELFKDLWIYDNWNWQKKHPVLHISFSSIGYRELGLEVAINQELDDIARQIGVSFQKEGISQKFKSIIQTLSKKEKVVVLIDEYDKPIIDYLEDLPQAKANRSILKTFYSVLKDSDAYLELVFITGVSRFAKTSIFSDLNNLTNITIHPLSDTLLGITEQELDHYFGAKIADIATEQSRSTTDLKAAIKNWYNGYSWNGEDRVYNPISLFHFLSTQRFRNYWFETGSPTFLIKLMRKKKYYNIQQTQISDTTLAAYDLENFNMTSLLFQTGYLTIKDVFQDSIFTLDYPNQEVKLSLEEYLLNAFRHDDFEKGKIKALELSRALQQHDYENFTNIINATFATIPYQLWQKENEAFYHALIHLTFSLMGAFVQSEVNSSNGRLDAKIETEDSLFILEFKLDQSAEEAIKQIAEKQYFQAYQDINKKRIGIGINFSSAQKEVANWVVKNF